MGRNEYYWRQKEQNAERAKLLNNIVESNEYIMDLTSRTLEHTRVYNIETIMGIPTKTKRTESKPIDIFMMNTNTVSAIKQVRKYSEIHNVNPKIAALNFASYKNPGGKFLEGSMAQEESLCHNSNLFSILSRYPEYYERNKTRLCRSLYTNSLLYTPDVIFFSDSDDFIKDNPVEYFNCDIMTCAAPNRYAAQKYKNVSDAENYYTLYNRIQFALDIANYEKVDVLILGAWGCGVFGQNPSDVASIFRELLDSDSYNFKEVIFAVPDTKNYKVFDRYFGKE